ncbi:IclR family transcriptional regulator [Lentzea sp. NPDC102401]|uniref:IclR family transcriptional regulator n=1 Tax=Lentzea sp. NPDC102401 TaxID=3364128 RepID=UPI00382E60EE
MTRQLINESAPASEHVLERAFKLLTALVVAERPMSLTSLSIRSNLPKTTVLRLARTLVTLGALERQVNGDYAIGLRLLELATLAPRGHGVRALALPQMEELRSATRQQVVLAVIDGTEAVLVERLSPQVNARSQYRVGGRIPLHATALGQCLLAHSPAALQNQILDGDLSVSPESIVIAPAELRARLAAVRRSATAVVTRTAPSPCMTVAGPVFGRNRQIVASLGVVTSLEAFNLKALRNLVNTACRKVSEANSS